MPDDQMIEEVFPVVADPVARCDHICRLDDGHVDRGECHQYGYEHPSPRDAHSGVDLLVLRSAARDLVDAASVAHTAEEWPAVLSPLISRLEQILEGSQMEVRSCVSVTAVTPVTVGSLCCAPDGSVLGRATNTAERGEQVGIRIVPESGENVYSPPTVVRK